MSLSAQQCRAARAWLGWSKIQLAKQAKVSRQDIAALETGTAPGPQALLALQVTFARAGIDVSTPNAVIVPDPGKVLSNV